MTSAVFEILFLLSVSCLIGIFFTFKYWKSRYQDVQSQIRQLWVNLSEKNMQIKAANARIVELETQLGIPQTMTEVDQ